MSEAARETVPAGISEALCTDLGRLDSVVPGLGGRASTFVITGTPEAVLLEIANHQRAVSQALDFGYGSLYFGSQQVEISYKARKTVLLAAPSLPVAVLHRLARIIVAANSNAGVMRRSAGNDDGGNWLRWLVMSTNQAVANGSGWGRTSKEVYKIWPLDRLCSRRAGPKGVARR